jgi:hypothetical protein
VPARPGRDRKHRPGRPQPQRPLDLVNELRGGVHYRCRFQRHQLSRLQPGFQLADNAGLCGLAIASYVLALYTDGLRAER